MEQRNNTLAFINAQIQTQPEAFVTACEARFQSIVDDAAEQIVSVNGRCIVMLAGPSASGKTTTAHKIAEAVQKRGNACYVISLDDFYLNRAEVPGYAEGKPDFETVYALDLPLLHTVLPQLLRGEATELPMFDFTIGKRAKVGKRLQLEPQDTIIVEGLHALNPIITDVFPPDMLLRLYISVSSRIYSDCGEVLLNKRALRFMRRLVRDYLFRASSAQNTLELWKNVRRGEDRYLFPYEELADIRIDSTHLYEPALFASLVRQLLQKEHIPAEFKAQTDAILSVLSNFEPLADEFVPKDSLLREFIGQGAGL